MRDIKEGFGIHPLRVPSDLIEKYGVNAYVDKLYRRVLYTWLVHLMSNQTERLVAFSTFSEKEIIEKYIVCMKRLILKTMTYIQS